MCKQWSTFVWNINAIYIQKCEEKKKIIVCICIAMACASHPGIQNDSQHKWDKDICSAKKTCCGCI